MVKTGKVTWKRYECAACGGRSEHATNHYGEIYGCCRDCPPWRRPSTVLRCLDPLPEGWGRPEPWRAVKLGGPA
jgi:hypothetical protein